MYELKKEDLRAKYSPTSYAGDNPKKIYSPDNDMLNRKEAYEVVDFINRYAKVYNLSSKEELLKVEKLIHQAPKNIRSAAVIMTWIKGQWDNT